MEIRSRLAAVSIGCMLMLVAGSAVEAAELKVLGAFGIMVVMVEASGSRSRNRSRRERARSSSD